MTVDIENEKIQFALKRAERYKIACRQAEDLLEKKSRELFETNEKLTYAKKEIEEDYQQTLNDLKESNERLQKSLNERSSFIGQMSHEVRTPLNAIVGLSEILLKTPLEEFQNDYVKTIHDGSNSLVTLLNNMLDISKMEAGRVTLHQDQLNPQSVNEQIINLHFQDFEKKGLTIELQVSPSVPKCIRIDESKYKQIITNLICNALKYTHQGGVVVTLDYTDCVITKGMGMLITKVIDTGIGIPAENLLKIFDAYEQIGRPGQGVGLGLTICHQLSKLMMGEIHCSSEVGKGSVFEVSVLAEKYKSEQKLDDTGLENNSPIIKPISILVAEDNPVNQKVFNAQLAVLGQKADMANNGAEALEMLKKQKYDVVFLDILMPVLDGEQVIKAIRESSEAISSQYCIALTASNYKDQYFIELGFDNYLSKPLLLSELSQALRAVPVKSCLNEFSDNHCDNNSVAKKNKFTLFDDSYLRTQFGDAYEMIFVEIAPSFIDHAYAELAILEDHINHDRSDKVSKVSHSIKGAASSLGLTQLSSLLMEIESKPSDASVGDTIEQIRSLMDKLKPEIETALQDARAAVDCAK